MKKLALLFLSGLLALYSCRTHFPVASSSQFALPGDDADLVNGKNLAFNVCGQCHYDWHIKSFIGEEMRDLPSFMGKVYSANLTRSHVIDAYSERELFYLIKTGVAKDGRFIPYMIRPTIADRDLRDIIAYLRSNDEPLRDNDSISGTTHLSWLGSLANKMIKPQEFTTGTMQPATEPVKQGRYLVDIMGCYHCHSKSILGLNYGNPEDSKGYLAGGMRFKIDGQKIYAPDIRMSGTAARYTSQSFRKAVKEGIAVDGRELHYPMRRFKHLTDEQSDAIFAYLQTQR